MVTIPTPEQSTIEFKSCLGKYSATLPHNLWQSISAFANTHGGTIYLGVNDEGHTVGLSRADLDKLQKDLSTQINNFFNRKPQVTITCKDQYLILHVSELELHQKPLYSRKVGPKAIYLRQGATNVLATEEEQRSLFAGSSGGGENQPIAADYASIVDPAKIDYYLAQIGVDPTQFSNLTAKLTKVKAIRDQALTIFGLIAFGYDHYIDFYLHNVYIDFKIFPSLHKVSQNLSLIYSERQEFHGDVIKQFTQAFAHITSRLPQQAILNKSTGLRESHYILPTEAFREALANTIAHRDYLLQSSCINIDLYPDRIELTNPGESLVAISDLTKSPSKARNPNLIDFLRTYHITDKTARGIPTIYQAAHNHNLLAPRFENISGIFKATLYFSSLLSADDQAWLQQITPNHNLKTTQQHALIHVRKYGSISNKEYCEINHMNNRNDDKQARRELKKLTELRLLTKTGTGPGTKYRLSI